MSETFPVFLRLAGRRVLLVGAGRVAAGKLDALRRAGAEVVVVAPAVSPEIEAAGVRIERRAFAPSDLDGAWLAVAAAPPQVNRAVAAEAESRRVFVNAVDDPGAASAYLGGVVRKGDVTLAVSTGGRAPALAGLLREALEAVLPDELPDWVDAAARLRDEQKRRGVPMDERRPALLAALNDLYASRGVSA